MRVPVAFAAIVVALMLSLVQTPGGIPVAHACSCGPCDFISESPVVVRGTVTGWDYVRDASGSPAETVIASPVFHDSDDWAHARSLEIRLTVADVFKGDVAQYIVIDEYQYDRDVTAEGWPPGEFRWPGAAGICFGLNEDPTGQDFLAILQPSETPGHYRFVVGPRPFAQSDLDALPGPPRPPSAGDSAPKIERIEVASNDWMFLSAIGAGFLLLTLVLLLVGPRDDRDHRNRQ